MKLPSFIYRSERVGKNGRLFSAYKIRTLKEGVEKASSFAEQSQYLRFGRFLRKCKLDELPQLINVLKGEMSLVGPRPEETRAIEIIPEEVRKILLSAKPGLTSLASLYFYDEEKLLQEVGEDKYRNYWTKVKPAKILLDTFYVRNKCLLLDLAVLWMTFKKVIKSLFNK